MSKLIRRQVITAKVESSYNTDAVPTGPADAIEVEDLSWQTEGLRMVERPLIRSSLATVKQLYGGSLLGVSFSCEVKGSGSAGVAPDMGALLLGCAMAETIVASTSVTYLPASSSLSSLTIYIYEDGTLIKMTGCAGQPVLAAEVGGRMMIAFSFIGHFSGPTDISLVTPTYDSTVPLIFINGAFDIGGFAAVIQALSVDWGNVIQTPDNFNAADGYGEVRVTGRDVNGSFNPEQPLVASKDFMSIFKAGTEEALDTGALGATAGNIVRIQLPKISYRNIAPEQREGVLAYGLPFGAAEDSGDDEASIEFT